MNLSQAIIESTVAVTRFWKKQIRAEERSRRARANRAEALTRQRDRLGKVSLIDAVFQEIRTGIDMASGQGRIRYPRRNLFYNVRDLIQKHTSDKLTSSYFEQLLVKWEEANGPVPGVYCDPRGYFVEPHTGMITPLGTRQVEDYTIPFWLYHIILFVEKKGFHELFKIGNLAERFDMGIICAEGYAVEATKMLLARAEKSSSKMTVCCMHDADPWGYNIARCLRAGDRINVIDFGLSLQEALDMGLTTEEFTRENALPQELELSDIEREYFEGEPCGTNSKGKTIYRCQRIELNALAADPDRFNRYVEDKLRHHGLAEKLVPPNKALIGRAKERRMEQLQEMARQQLAKLLKEDELTLKLAKRFARDVTVEDMPLLLAEWAEKLEPKRWDDCLEERMRDRTNPLKERIAHEVLVKMREIATQL